MTDVTKMLLRTRQTIGWIDLLRVIAIFLVVFAHCCDGFVAAFDSSPSSFLTGVFAGSLTRPSVPLFVMMTGVLLLPIPSETDTAGFYRKRLGRLLWPFVFWSIALPLMFWGYFNTAGAASANPMLSPADYTTGQLSTRLWSWILNFNFDTVPLWYLYMLAGLYLAMPMLSAWLRQASKSDILIVLRIWGFTLLLPYLSMLAPLIGYEGNFGNMGLYGVCDWNTFGTFYYLSGFTGYLLTAYYLTRWPLQQSWGRLLSWAIPSFIIGYCITSFGYVWFQQMFPGNYAYLEIIWLFCGINVAMMTIPVFVIIQKINPAGRQWLTRLAFLSFGIYLCHFVFVYIAYDLFDIATLPAWLRIIAMTATVYLVSLALVRIFAASAHLRKFIA